MISIHNNDPINQAMCTYFRFNSLPTFFSATKHSNSLHAYPFTNKQTKKTPIQNPTIHFFPTHFPSIQTQSQTHTHQSITIKVKTFPQPKTETWDKHISPINSKMIISQHSNTISNTYPSINDYKKSNFFTVKKKKKKNRNMG